MHELWRPSVVLPIVPPRADGYAIVPLDQYKRDDVFHHDQNVFLRIRFFPCAQDPEHTPKLMWKKSVIISRRGTSLCIPGVEQNLVAACRPVTPAVDGVHLRCAAPGLQDIRSRLVPVRYARRSKATMPKLGPENKE